VYEDDVAPLLPAGTVVHVMGWYNKSVTNKNVVDPRNWNGYGNRSIDDMLVVEPDADALADHEDAEGVPLAEGAVGEDERVFAGRASTIVPEASRAFVGSDRPFASGFGGVPYLDLRHASEVDAAVGVGDGFVFEEELEVCEELVGCEVEPVAVVDKDAVVV